MQGLVFRLISINYYYGILGKKFNFFGLKYSVLDKLIFDIVFSCKVLFFFVIVLYYVNGFLDYYIVKVIKE